MTLTTVNSDGVKDDSIKNIDIKSDAAIEGSKLDNPLQLPDNHKISFGTDGTGDLEIFHNGTDTHIDNNTGDLYLTTTGSGDDIFITAVDNISLTVHGSENAINCTGGGSVDLYYNNSKVLWTDTYGAKIQGKDTSAASILYITGNDGQNALINFQADRGDDNNDHFQLECGQGTFTIQDASNGSTWEKNIQCTAGGSVDLYFDNSQKLVTTTNGIKVENGCITATGANSVNETSCIKLSYEGSSKGQIRVYGANASTTGSLEFKVSEGDGTDEHTMTLDAAGRLLIGTSEATAADTWADNFIIHSGAGNGGMCIASSSGSSAGSITFSDGTTGNSRYRGYVQYDHGSEIMNFGTNGSTHFTMGNNHFTIADGNLVIANGGYGIDFSAQTATNATGASHTAELLDHYEEGTWTPVLWEYDSGNGGWRVCPLTTAPTMTAVYTRIGRIVTASLSITTMQTNSGGEKHAKIWGLPFGAVSGSYGGGYLNYQYNAFTSTDVQPYVAGTYIEFYRQTGAWTNWTNTAGANFYVTVQYPV